ncbi:PhzF family phenazine biosynthesis protein [Nocardia sp. NPDC058058]|uniref:PhzF family phenazine biosynthesis protein n=1 Tax=Nocardia sp. NPDC058058 TaxID=3346317 RepID=UPI0036DBF6E2
MGIPESDGAQIEVVRVFTDATGRFGNPLGIARAADVEGVDHQALAARVGYSETVVVREPENERTSMRIYTPAVELPFAGHPSVGTGWWLFLKGHPVSVIDVPAGPVDVSVSDGMTWVRARSEWAPAFTFHQFESVEEIATLDPADFPEGKHYVWGWSDEARGAVRTRMFAPAMGIPEDEATGAAAIALTANLRRGLYITQGEGSQLFTEWDSDGWVRLGGRVVEDHPVVI